MEKETGQVESEWTSYKDFEAAIAKLPAEFQRAPVKAASEEKIENSKEFDPSLAYKLSYVLRHLYESTGGLVSSNLWSLHVKTTPKIRADFLREVQYLWRRRREAEPVPMVYSRESEVEFSERMQEATKAGEESQLREAKEKFAELEARAKIMGPKKRARFEEQPEFVSAKQRVAELLKEAEKKSWRAQTAGTSYEEGRKKSEMGYRKAVNELLPLLSGEEFFDANLQMIKTFLLGLSQNKKEEVGKALEDALLEWAMTYINDGPVIQKETKQAKARTEQVKSIGIVLSPAGQKVWKAIHETRAALSVRPSPATLQHARLLMRTFDSLLERAIEKARQPKS